MISFRNSRITPVYDTISGEDLTARPDRRNAWVEGDVESEQSFDFAYNKHQERRYVNDVDLILRDSHDVDDSAAIEHRYVSNHSGLRRHHFGNIDAEEQKSREERELDRTVQWAMNNFYFSETGKSICLTFSHFSI